MKKKHWNLLISLITILVLIEFLFNSQELINTFFNTINLCFNNLLPNIFIFFTITDILNNYHFPYYLSQIFGKVFEKFYHLPKCGVYVIIMSLTSGFPGNSKLISDLLDQELITNYDATKLLTMTHFSNPLFIIYTIGINFFHDAKIGFIILFSHFITNFIVGFLFRNIYKYQKNNMTIRKNSTISFISLLKISIYRTTKLIINVFGIIIIFSLITNILLKYLNLNSFSNAIISGLMEITTGLKSLSILNLNKIKAATIATFFISFGGFSIHLQTMSILNKYQINYYIYLLSRILHGTLSSILTFIIISKS